MPETKVDSGAGAFNVYQGGKGAALVLLHSMAASWWSWSRSIPLLEEHFSVCAPDLLGHGKSEAKRDVVSVEHHAASLEGLPAALGLADGFYLAGAALGALVAIELALRKPELIRGLLLLGPPGFPSAQARSEWLANRVATFVGPDGLAAPMDEATVFARYAHREPGLVEHVNQERTQAGLWALHDLWAIGSYDSAEKARQLKVSTIITCYGEHDPFLPGRPGITQALPKAEHMLLEGAAHYPAWDAPEQIAQLMLKLRS
ncbi:MAG TPA: alpha/beta hydrolase [Chloroflexota bacterium]|nr:alpha/beta hydrolase [Chloroflexota bacterium]